MSGDREVGEALSDKFVLREGLYHRTSICDMRSPTPYVRVAPPQLSPPAQQQQHYSNGVVAPPPQMPQPPHANEPMRLSSLSYFMDEDSVELLSINFGLSTMWYDYRGPPKPVSVDQKSLFRRMYRPSGTAPTCHDVSEVPKQGAAGGVMHYSLVGFSAGQIQLLDYTNATDNILFNESRTLDKSRVTCVKWIPDSDQEFVASFASGNMFLFNNVEEQLPVAPPAAAFHTIKRGDTFCISQSKAKSTKNPLCKWTVGNGAINDISFCRTSSQLLLAIGSADGFVRIFDYERKELMTRAMTYFGAVLALSWSPDAKYVAFGGEDDLIHVLCLTRNKIAVRCRGHRSWVTGVQFDRFFTSLHAGQEKSSSSSSSIYRLGSVSLDTHFCLWHLTSDVLTSQPPPLLRSNSRAATGPTQLTNNSSANASGGGANLHRCNSLPGNRMNAIADKPGCGQQSVPEGHKFSTLHFGGGGGGAANNVKWPVDNMAGSAPPPNKRDNKSAHKHNSKNSSDKLHTLSNRNAAVASTGTPRGEDELKVRVEEESGRRVFGSPCCPRISATPLIDPLTMEKVSAERVTSLRFMHRSIVFGCQDGSLVVFARPLPPPPPTAPPLRSSVGGSQQSETENIPTIPARQSTSLYSSQQQQQQQQPAVDPSSGGRASLSRANCAPTSQFNGGTPFPPNQMPKPVTRV